MTNPAVKKDEIKKHVRALLMSSPAALTVQELERDFYNFIGVRLAYKAIGYSTIEDFLRDNEDTVTISYKNGMMTLKAKADETTKHIEKLVSKQRVTNKKKYAVYRNRGGGPPRLFQGSNRYPPRRAPAPGPVVPAYVKKQIKELFHSFPDGILITHIDRAFSRVYGTGINYGNYGFKNQYEFLQSLKDIVKVEELYKGELRVLPVNYIRASVTKPPVSNNRGKPEQEKTQSEQQPTLPTSNRKNTIQIQSQKRPSKGRGRRRENSGGNDDVVGHDTQSVGSTKSHDNEDLGREIQQVLEEKPKGIWASRFPFEFSDLHGKPLDYREHGYLSVIDFLSAMPDIVRTVRPNPQGDWMLYDARLPLQDQCSEDLGKARSRHCSGKAVETETKEAIQIILSSRPSGIPVKDFPEDFKEYTGRKLPVRDLGFDSPEDLFLSLADSILQFAYNGNEMLMYSMDTEIIETEQAISKSVPSEEQKLDDYPADVVGPGCHFVPVMLPNREQYVELYVTNVVSPGLFWVMLRHKTKSLALEALMDKLDEIYEKKQEADAYRMPESLMVPGQICATLFPEDNNWHRGVITGSNDSGFIEIYYVDYGNTNFVQKSTIRFLKSEFITLPAQAVQARLANTHPVTGINGKWKNKSRSRLLELTCHRPLVAYVCDVKSQKMSLCLTDTNQPDVDIHINDVIVNEGLAIFTPDAEVLVSIDTQKHSAEPDYGHVFGWTFTDTPRLPRIAQSQNISKTESEGSDRQMHCYVKWIQLDESCVMHLINLNRQAYIVSAEISNLFWEEDVLTSMLKKKKMELEKRVVSSDEFPDLFQELVKYKVKSVRCDGDAKRQFLSLYKLESLPKILLMFEHESQTLLTAVQELIVKFDPDSPYWKSGEVVEEKQAEKLQDEESGEQALSVEEKQMALKALQFKRKRILQSMMSSVGSLQDDVVNQLNNCEVEIMMLKQELKEQASAAVAGSDDMPVRAGQDFFQSEPGKNAEEESNTVNEDQTSENQRVIRNIIASATKPIATANIMTKPVTSTVTSKPLTRTSHFDNQSNMSGSFMSQSGTGSLPEMLGPQNMSGSFMSQAGTGSLPEMLGPQNMSGSFMSQAGTGSLPEMLGPQNMSGSFMSQAGSGSLPEMLGPQNMAFMQQQRMFNPMFMAQTGLPPTGMGDMANTVMAGNLGLGMGFSPNFQPGLLPQLNPLLFQLQTAHSANMSGVGGINHMAAMQHTGRGQALNPSSIGILPGLLPLVQNLSAGRGGRGSGSCNNQ